MDIRDVQRIANLTGYVSQILIKCVNPLDANSIAQQIQDMYPGIRAVVPSSFIAQASQLINSWSMFFLSIGTIALTIGGFGVANTMFMAVAERIREIGILKAIGARSSNILYVFIMETVFLGLIGGVIGVLIGAIISSYLPSVLNSLIRVAPTPDMPRMVSRGGNNVMTRQITLLQPVITPNIVLLALGLGLIISMVAGLYPAIRASRLKPVEAMKYVF